MFSIWKKRSESLLLSGKLFVLIIVKKKKKKHTNTNTYTVIASQAKIPISLEPNL